MGVGVHPKPPYEGADDSYEDLPLGSIRTPLTKRDFPKIIEFKGGWIFA
jgi:hypothetical protein